MEQVYRGMNVVDASGPIGTVGAIDYDATTGTQYVHVQLHDGSTRVLKQGTYAVVGDELRIDQPLQQNSDLINTATGTSATTVDRTNVAAPTGVSEDQDSIRIPVIAEEVVVGTRVVERGGVRVHKRVNEREEVVEQPTMHEDVAVERVTIGRMVDAAPEARQEGDTLIIPVLEEVLVVEKRLVLKEEIRVTRRRSETIEQARVVLREEEVQIEDLSEQSGPTDTTLRTDPLSAGTPPPNTGTPLA